VKYEIIISPQAAVQIEKIKDARVRRALYERIEKLAIDPLLQGDPLGDELKGYRNVRAVGQRYRVIYRVDDFRIVVFVFGVGLRREGSPDDVYAEATRAIRRQTRQDKKPKK
jgi:mRNA interferase RelE/StbE